jgi:hypothetical protein
VISTAYTEQRPLNQMIDELAAATNAAAVWNGGTLTMIPYGDQSIAGNGKTYVPNLAPVFTFTNDDFVRDSSSGGATPAEDPIAWTRKRPSDRTNHIKVEYADVNNAYNVGNVEVKNQALIDQFGLRTKTASGTRLFRTGNAAYLSAQLMLQREAVMNTCAFALDARYCVLDPMDIVAVPDPAGSIVAVRITEITENDDDTFSVVAEELVPGMGTAVLNGYAAATGYSVDTGGAPGSVNANPLIWQATTQLTQRSQRDQLYFGASGGANFGGCQVWVSADGGATYAQVAQINRQCRQGIIAATSSLPDYTGVNPDNTNTPTIDMSMSGGVLESFTAGAAAAGASLCLIETQTNGNGNTAVELITYVASALVSANKYQLSSLYRSFDGTTHAAHAAGAPFMRIDTSLAVWTMPPSRYATVTLHIKFLAFNMFGQGLQGLSDPGVVDYTFTPV